MVTEVTPQKTSEDTPQAPGLRWRGIWDEDEQYTSGDVVINPIPLNRQTLGSDPKLGLFVCIADPPVGNQPVNQTIPSGLSVTTGETDYWFPMTEEHYNGIYFTGTSPAIRVESTATNYGYLEDGRIILSANNSDGTRTVAISPIAVPAGTSIALRWIEYNWGSDNIYGAYFLCSEPVVVGPQ